MTTQEILDELNEQADGGDEILLADGFEEALIGTVFGACRQPVACYDYDKCAQILMERDHMDWEEAYEFLDFNTVGAYVGVGTPLFIRNLRTYDESAHVDVEAGAPLDDA